MVLDRVINWRTAMLAEVVVVDSSLMGGAVSGGPDAPPMAGPTPKRTRYPDAQQLFVGNLPLDATQRIC